MKRIILSLLLITGTVSVLAYGATGAFFSDTETSTGNTFTAGAIDIKIDNESYYNGVLNPATSWELTDLTTTEKFFNFLDLKPDDSGEDTISIHVDTNDAYLCANVTLTSNDDNTQTEPEAPVDTNGLASGELANLVNFIWWADDGDNVLESGENVISQGPIGALSLNDPYQFTLADSDENIWTGGGSPVPGNTTKYIGKAWCFGTLGTLPITQDNSGTLMSPAGNNGGTAVAGEPEDGGITCDGTLLGNESQTDSLTADISFSAVQARHNPNFQCDGECTFDNTVNLLTDGGFELPEVTIGDQWDVFSSPAGGWQVDWRGDIPATFGAQNRPAIAKLELHEGVLGSAFEGDQYAELDSDWGGPSDPGTGEPASISIYRTFATIPGANYTLKYHFAPRPNTVAAENSLEVKIEGVTSETIVPTAGGGGPIAWSEHVLNFTATDASTEIRFTDLGTANSLGTFLDNVRLYQTSCPNI